MDGTQIKEEEEEDKQLKKDIKELEEENMVLKENLDQGTLMCKEDVKVEVWVCGLYGGGWYGNDSTMEGHDS